MNSLCVQGEGSVQHGHVYIDFMFIYAVCIYTKHTTYRLAAPLYQTVSVRQAQQTGQVCRNSYKKLHNLIYMPPPHTHTHPAL